RRAMAQAGLMVGGAVVGEEVGVTAVSASPATQDAPRPFRYCLNMATIRGQKLGLVKEIEVAAQAGYDAIEPWVRDIQDYVQKGGTLAELRKRLSDSGLTMESAIAFSEWLVEDDDRRAKGLERAKREMELVARLGGKRYAAPPAGATELPRVDLKKAAERYRALLEAGEQSGVVAQLELWGFSKNLGQLGECVGAAMETGHPHARVLADVYHLYKGGTDIHGIRLLGSNALQVLHMNDYPSEPPREKIDDSFRVYPGDGVAPMAEVLRLLRGTGGQKVLSLEVFNRSYWAQDALEVARTGLAKMKAVAEKV